MSIGNAVAIDSFAYVATNINIKVFSVNCKQKSISYWDGVNSSKNTTVGWTKFYEMTLQIALVTCIIFNDRNKCKYKKGWSEKWQET